MLPKKIGLIAGKGEFPILVAKELRKRNAEVYCIGLVDISDRKIRNCASKLKWIKLGRLKLIIEYFKQEGIDKIIIAGLIKHSRIFDSTGFDELTRKMFARIKDNRADSVLGAIAEEFTKENIELIPAISFLKDYVVDKGTLTKIVPDKVQMENINFGFNIAKQIARFDIGQTVIIKNKSIIAVEAMEGTDKCIYRAGRLVGQDSVVIKVSKPKQDWRFDVPIVGLRTLEVMNKIKSNILAIESGKTIILDKKEVIEKANKYGIIIYGI